MLNFPTGEKIRRRRQKDLTATTRDSTTTAKGFDKLSKGKRGNGDDKQLRHSVEPTSIRRRSAETGRRSPSMQRKFQRYATQIKTDTDCATSHLPLDNFSSTSSYFIYIKVSLPQAASMVEAIKIAWRGCSKRSPFAYIRKFSYR